MSFKVNKIRDEEPNDKANKIEHSFQKKKINFSPKKKRKTSNVLLIATIVAVFTVSLMGLKIIKSFSFEDAINWVVFNLEAPLEKDPYGNTNILLVGTGGGIHDGADLTDTIILASIDRENSQTSMLSIPRDLFIDQLGYKINAVYEYDGIETLKETVQDITGIDVHYYVKVDFNGFEELIDALGGIEIFVEQAIYDPFYPAEVGIGYAPFKINAGLQNLDGETALKYARSRKTTSDYSRAARQQQIIFGMKEKALEGGLLGNADKLQDYYNYYQNNVESDLSIQEIITLASIGKDLNKEQIKNYVLNDDPLITGGLLAVPPQELYGGAFVLIPADNTYRAIQKFTDIIFHYQKAVNQETPILILNSSSKEGLAGLTYRELLNHGLSPSGFDNGIDKTLQKTTVYFLTEESKENIEVLKQFLSFQIKEEIPLGYEELVEEYKADIIIDIGKDFKLNTI